MKILAGGRCTRGTPAPTQHRAADHRQLARAGDEVHLQVLGEDEVADQVAITPKAALAIITGTMARPSRPSVRFTAFENRRS
jgi:hypothetical protein